MRGRACAAAIIVAATTLMGTAAAAPDEVTPEEIRGPDASAEVFMQVDASDEQIAAVRAAVEFRPDVELFAYFDQRAALREFKRIFRKNRDLAENITADSLPASFRVVLNEAANVDLFVAELSALPGVEDIAVRGPGKPTCDQLPVIRSNPVDAQVFMHVRATAKQIGRVRFVLEQHDNVEDFDFDSKEEAVRIFRRLLPDHPDAATVTSEELPASFDVQLRDADGSRRFARTMRKLSGVKSVTQKRNVLNDLFAECDV